MAANPFTDSRKLVQEMLCEATDVNKGKTLAEAGIDPSWLRSYGVIARRCRDDKDFGITPYPFEQGPGVGAVTGGFFEHRDWPLRRGMEKHRSLRAIVEYEANYVNASGYWMAFHECALDLRQESIDQKKDEDALQYDVWARVSIRYGLRVVGLRAEFHKMAAKDPSYAKLVMPTLEKRNKVAAADDLQESMNKLETHLSTQLMKAVATLSASNATKRAGRGGAAGDN